MSPETPLTEVAHHLPSEVAGLLVHRSPALQEAVLKCLRNSLIWLESEQVDLDRVQYDAVVSAMTVQLISLYSLIEELGEIPVPSLDLCRRRSDGSPG